jgi:hypothetical protein
MMRTLGCAGAMLVASTGALAQGRTVDDGTFVYTRDGAPVGREVFRITRSVPGLGEQYRATAQLSFGERRATLSLSTDSAGFPLVYDVVVREGTATTKMQARGRPGRFSVLEQTKHGESAKEYIIPQRAVVLDEDAASQYYFVVLAGSGGAMAVLVPQDRAQVNATLERRGAEPVEIGGERVPATHYALVGSGPSRREFWLDSTGRVLKVVFPERGLVAQREEAPR